MRFCRFMSLVLILLSLLSAAAFAGPPYETDDPEPTDTGHWEIYLASIYTATALGGSGALPQLELNYGPLKDTQISASTQMSATAVPGSGLIYGFGDLLLGLKYRFLHESERCPQAAFYPQIYLPSGDARRGLGYGSSEILLPLYFQKSFGLWQSFGGGGYQMDPSNSGNNSTFIGCALQRELTERLSVGGEIFYHSMQNDAESDGLGANLAALLQMDSINHVVASFGRDLIGGENTFTGYLAWEWTI